MLDRLRTLLTPPPPVTRTAEEQRRVDAETASWALYAYATCPYCVRVERTIERLALTLERRDVRREPSHRQALIAGGGRSTVPCLRLPDASGSDRWLYESADIIAFLEARFSG